MTSAVPSSRQDTDRPQELPLVGTPPQAAHGTQETEFYLPELPRLLPSAYHPNAVEIEVRSNAWVCRHLQSCFTDEQALLSYLRQRAGLYGPAVSPLADGQRAGDIADFYQYVTIVDDAIAGTSTSEQQARGALARITHGFGTETDDTSPLIRAGADLWRRITPGLSPAQVGRFKESLAISLGGYADEVPHRHAGHVLALDGYMKLRVVSFGWPFVALMTEYGARVDMIDLHPTPEFEKANGHAVRQMILVNDLLSWRKEHARADTMNAVAVLQHNDNLDLQDAVNALCHLIEAEGRAYLTARDRILNGPLGGRTDVATYLDALDHLIGGTQAYHYLTPRYFGDGYAPDGSTSGWLSLTEPLARLRPQPQRTPTVA
ncbi:terpene synthase family protein [Streptomyces sp. NBC_01237]|uniref:terpene synthase family protein n=1 Tax=Streptomyces sp. NBC_01237 TaxID=2903790 RepID=UPI002DD948E3|nr:terpene synthase family protein [Streptomyces sp. NBC_01237]WRZ76424.1 terpene synthase family protein [Streptomyces sp. NBC_01237]